MLEEKVSPQLDPSWRKSLFPFQNPTLLQSLWQIAHNVIPYVALWFLIYKSLAISFWLAIPLIVLAAGFLIRIFIIFHDCGHGSFFKSKAANDIVGSVLGLFMLVPYYHWTWEHALHHATAGDLDQRGDGDLWTMTVDEYAAASKMNRFVYWMSRNPIVIFLIAPVPLFFLKHRFTSAKATGKEKYSVYATTLALISVMTVLSLIMGFKNFFIIQVSIMAIAGAAGIWLFYIQHQFEGVYWERHDEWEYAEAAFNGSSYFKLPRILQFFSGNIGFHHVHHLNSRIPNYNLEKCHDAVPFLQTANTVTISMSYKATTLRLWDEKKRKMVAFGNTKKTS